MFEYIPSANIIILKWILHNWNDEECTKILKRCKEAIMVGGQGKTDLGREGEGKLMVIDMVIGENKEAIKFGWSETELLFDIIMMTSVAGQQRCEKEWAKLFTDAGFSKYEITVLVGSRYIIEVYP